MLVGWANAVAVGPLLVEKVDDVSWLVIVPDGDVAEVCEDPLADGPAYLGPGWAVDAVLLAEQVGDEAELAAKAVPHHQPPY